ncbi:MAG: hypothetical protein NTX50_19840 [Candidatus Sumerlaeota bacterium]|nr:hypothetical protein [Candidatus Sumerlaeota bacterium]
MGPYRKWSEHISDMIFIAAVAMSALSFSAYAQQTNIDPSHAGNINGYGANIGWVNLQGDVTSGVVVRPTYVSGWAWSANVGWICLGAAPANGRRYANDSATDFGVNNDGHGGLSGYAWGSNIGWIAFDTSAAPGGGARVSINSATGNFEGFAWSANCGWIAFEGVPAQSVAATDTSVVTAQNAIAALRDYLCGRSALPQALRDIADFNSDGRIDVADILLLVLAQ